MACACTCWGWFGDSSGTYQIHTVYSVRTKTLKKNVQGELRGSLAVQSGCCSSYALGGWAWAPGEPGGWVGGSWLQAPEGGGAPDCRPWTAHPVSPRQTRSTQHWRRAACSWAAQLPGTAYAPAWARGASQDLFFTSSQTFRATEGDGLTAAPAETLPVPFPCRPSW